MKDKIFGVLQRVGRSFMLPIALLPVAGLLLGLGSSFTNATTIETYHLGNIIYEGGLLYTILDLMSKAGSAVFDNLALLFAMGVSIGMAKKEKEVAALSGAIAYLVKLNCRRCFPSSAALVLCRSFLPWCTCSLVSSCSSCGRWYSPVSLIWERWCFAPVTPVHGSTAFWNVP